MEIVGMEEVVEEEVEEVKGGVGEYGEVGVGGEEGKREGEYGGVLYKKEGFELLEKNRLWV